MQAPHRVRDIKVWGARDQCYLPSPEEPIERDVDTGDVTRTTVGLLAKEPCLVLVDAEDADPGLDHVEYHSQR